MGIPKPYRYYDDIGIQGTTGYHGIQGIQGVQGTTGYHGIQGIQGVQGTTGSQEIKDYINNINDFQFPVPKTMNLGNSKHKRHKWFSISYWVSRHDRNPMDYWKKGC